MVAAGCVCVCAAAVLCVDKMADAACASLQVGFAREEGSGSTTQSFASFSFECCVVALKRADCVLHAC